MKNSYSLLNYGISLKKFWTILYIQLKNYAEHWSSSVIAKPANKKHAANIVVKYDVPILFAEISKSIFITTVTARVFYVRDLCIGSMVECFCVYFKVALFL